MQQRPPPPPRWPRPVPQIPWIAPPVRRSFVPLLSQPPRGFRGPPRFFPPPPRPIIGIYPRCVPRPLVVNAEQLWLDSFRRRHCSSADSSNDIVGKCDEPPLRLLRRRVAKAQTLTEQLKVASTELAALEKRLEASRGSFDGDTASMVEGSRLRVQRERKLAACEALKKQLDAMNAASGLFPEKQLAEIRAFAARVNKKKAYRKRAKLKRRAEASIRRAVDAKVLGKTAATGDDKVESQATKEHLKVLGKSTEKDLSPPPQEEKTATYLSTPKRTSPQQSLDPETLTIATLIAVRRAWDAYTVVPQTPGASSIPPHFVPPPSAPPAPWAAYISSVNSAT